MSQTSPLRIAVYAGSFDPMTLGHEDIIRRGARLFDQLIVGIGINPEKQPLFSPEERRDLIGCVVSDLPNVRVTCFEGLSVDFVRQNSAQVMLRGVRTVSDMEAEFTMALANHVLAPDVETVFLMAGERFSHISSTLIKQVAQMSRRSHGDLAATAQLSPFVPQPIIAPLLAKYQSRAQPE